MARILVVFLAFFLYACGGDDPPSVTPPIECEAGYQRLGNTCVDIDECEDPDRCEEGETCQNGDGTYSCEPANTPDPCDSNPCGDGTCSVMGEGYMCACPTGQSFGENTCVPDESSDECVDGTATCSEFATCFNTVDGYDCVCQVGYQGDGFTCVDQDGCAGDPCFAGVVCTDVQAPGEGFMCGDCPIGYDGDGITCTPSDCPADTCFTGVSCTSPSPGTYECGSCPNGYEGDGVTCTPVDACLSTPCFTGVVCTSTGPGAYACGACPAGYQGDGESCTDINECSTNPCDSNATCTNFPGTFACVCDSGYVGDGYTCFVPSTCDPATPGTCSSNAECADPDSDGVYSCFCNAGFEGNGETCVDINECTRNTDDCSANASCTNTVGSFNCACNTGYEGDGVTCSDVDGCTSNPCYTGVICTDVAAPGVGFTCGACPAGMEGNGITCTDINGCANAPCFTGVTCTDVVAPGSGFSCGTCPAGFEGDGITCTDIDGCANDPCFTNVTCTDVVAPGTGFTCGTCPSGYEGNGITCTVVDVCATSPCFTGVTCTNNPSLPGGYACGTCPAGYQGDGITCTDIDGCANNPCFTGVTCNDLAAPQTGFFCDPCPAGYSGDGITCVEQPSSCTPNPCYPTVACNDDGNGNYSCGSCPAGMVGDGVFCRYRISEVPSFGGLVSGFGTYDPGATVTMSATPFDSQNFTGWDVGGSIVSTQNPWVFQATQSLSIQAIFTTKTHTITVNPGTNGTTTGSGQFLHGESVLIQATPNQYYTFQHWTDELGNQITSNPYVFSASANKTFTATFAYTPPPSYTVALSADPAGAATVTQSGGGTYFQGDSVTINVVPNAGYVFVRWRTPEFAQVSTDPQFTFNIFSNRQYIAEVKQEFQVTVDKVFKRNTEFITTNNGSATGGGTYLNGQTALLEAVPPAGAKFWRWVDQNNNVLTSQNPVSVTVGSNLTYRAVFVSYVQHVSTTGSDVTGRGTTNLPWRTPQAAVQFLTDHSARDGGEVRVQAGSYDVDPLAPLTITGGLKLLGGYASNWNRLYLTAANRNSASTKTDLRSTQTMNLPTPVAAVQVSGKGSTSGQMSLIEGFNIYGGLTGVSSTLGVLVVGAELGHSTVYGGQGSTSRIAVQFSGDSVIHHNVTEATTWGIVANGYPPGANVYENDIYGGGMGTLYSTPLSTLTAVFHSNRFRPDPVTNIPARFSSQGRGNIHFYDNVFFPGFITGTTLTPAVSISLNSDDPSTITIEGNTIVGPGGANTAGLQLTGSATLARVRVWNNTIFGGLTNVIGGSVAAAIIDLAAPVSFINNTLDTGRLTGPNGARMICGVKMGSNVAYRNNILLSTTNLAAQGMQSATNYLTGICTSNYATLSVQYSNFWPEELTYLRPAVSPFTITAYNGTGSYLGNVSVDPRLANSAAVESAGGDWRLTVSSPASVKYGGLDVSTTFTEDKDGALRTTGGPAPGNGGSGWSMGAYEAP